MITWFCIAAGVLYCARAVAAYRALRAAATEAYGSTMRGPALVRAALWCIPSRIYHWRHHRWEAAKRRTAKGASSWEV